MADQTANDIRFKVEDWTELLDTLKDSILGNLRISMPVRVTEDSDGHTVKLQPLIKGAQLMPDGSVKAVELPVMPDIPINHHGGGGNTLTHPHKKDDEGIALISHIGFDFWFQQGGVQTPGDTRPQALSDAFYLPGVRSTPRKLENVSTASTQLRSDDGKHLYDLHPKEGAKVSIENAKHVMSFHPTNGIAASVENGKHKLSLTPQNGIAIDTVMKLALSATQGMALTGNLNVQGNIGASGTIGAPNLLGQTGGIFTGIASGIFGTLLVLGAATGLLAAYGPPEAIQRASYTLAAFAR